MTHFERALTFLRGAAEFALKGIRELWRTALEHKLISLGIGAAVLGLAIGLSLFVFKAGEAPKLDDRREVTLITVGDVSAAEPLSLIGEVRSKREASVTADAPGTVAAVYRSLGDTVGAGAVIAELKNDSQKAAVAQAKAALDKAQSGTAVGTISVDNAKNAFTAAQESAVTAIDGAYSAIDDAVARKADQMFSNPSGNQPKFNIVLSSSQLSYTVESKRLAMSPILARHASASAPVVADAQLAELSTLSNEAASVADFLSSVVTALAGAIPTNGISDAAIAGYRSDANTALTGVNALRTSLSATIQDLKTKKAAVDIALQGVTPGATGVSADIAGAQANLAAAEAQLEKTLIRAPISGTINRLDLNVGDFVNASTPVVFITNPDGLEIVAYLSDRDIADVAVGAPVLIGGTAKGSVTKAASALDPVTKKAEIRISVPPGAHLISGSSATIAITPTVKAAGATPSLLTIPLSAVKIIPEGSEVFTVSDGGALMSHAVTLGTLRGSKVEITSGLTGDMRIVEDARGLKEGQVVMVKGG